MGKFNIIQPIFNHMLRANLTHRNVQCNCNESRQAVPQFVCRSPELLLLVLGIRRMTSRMFQEI